jgi:hypothetical protein
MARGGSLPKTQSHGHNRQLAWREIPSTHDVPRPDLPRWRDWNIETRRWWRLMWSKPVAALWDPSGTTLWALAGLWDDVFSGREELPKLAGEIRQREESHGIAGPKSEQALRIKIVEPKKELSTADLLQRARELTGG